jgi:hypothetical protein
MRIIEDTKTAKSHVAKVVADPTAKSAADAARKLHIHIVCIIVAGTASVLLVALHVSSPIVLGYGPIVPSVVQEIMDWIFRL